MRTVLTAVAAALVAVAGLVAVVAAPGPAPVGAHGTAPVDGPPPTSGEHGRGFLDGTDRGVLAPPAAAPDGAAGDPGTAPLPVDPAVDPTDPAAVAVAYLVVVHAAVPADAGRAHRRAAGWAEPGSVPGTVGVLVLDAPAPGSVRTARVGALDLVAADPSGTRRLYRALVLTATGPPGAEAAARADVVLVRGADGRWSVRSESPTGAGFPAGED